MPPKRRAREEKPDRGRARSDDGRAGPKDRRPAAESRADARAPADQLGAILTKGLDLAEASLSMGLTMISRMGTIAQQQVLDRFPLRPPAPDGISVTPGDEAPAASAPAPEAAPPAAEDGYCIMNRLPLAPGGDVHVSFSINNDSMAAPKQVEVRIEGFTGQVEGATIAPDRFTVKPPKKTIAPMDFEKFVLRGAVPPEAPPDVYLGWVVVASGGEFRIPVRLVVAP